MTFGFLATSLVVVLLPGTGVLYTLAVGLGRGWRASIFAAFGCTLGIVPQALLAILGLAAVLAASSAAFAAVRILGACWLLSMAWGVLGGGGSTTLDARVAPVSSWRLVRDGIALNLFNPKLAMFFLAFLPQFVPSGAGSTQTMLVLSLVFMAMTFVVFIGYGGCAAWARRHILERPAVLRWLRRGFATCFVALGVRLALSPR